MMQPQYLLTILLAITKFATANLVAGRPAPATLQDTTQHYSRGLLGNAKSLFKRPSGSHNDDIALSKLANNMASFKPNDIEFIKSPPVQLALECAKKLHSNNLPPLLDALDTARKALNPQSGGPVSTALIFTTLMKAEYEALVKTTRVLAELSGKLHTETRTATATTARRVGSDIWPLASALDNIINRKEKFVQIGGLLGKGNKKLRRIVDELITRSNQIVQIEKKLGNMGVVSEHACEIIRSMADSAYDMLTSQEKILETVKKLGES